MTPEEARKALEPLVDQMAQTLIDDDDGTPRPEGPSVLTGWILVTVLSTYKEDGVTSSGIRTTPMDNQPDYASIGMLRQAEMMYY